MNSMKNKYKLMTNPSYSRLSCSAYGCDMRSGTNALSEIKMFHFPRNPYRRRRWELATRRANWKANTQARLCSKHFITGQPSKDPEHPDFVPSIFVFSKNVQKKKGKRNSSVDESSENSAACPGNTSSHEGTCINPNCGVRAFCGSCFSTESVTSAFNVSLAPLNQTLAHLMEKLKDMEEERNQLRNELAICREEIHELRETHQNCTKQSQPTSRHSKPHRSVSDASRTSDSVTEILESMYSDEPVDIDDPDPLSSQFLEDCYLQSDNLSESKRQKKWSEEMSSDEVMGIIELCPSAKKKSVKGSNLESEDINESPKVEKSSDSSSPITIVYLKR